MREWGGCSAGMPWCSAGAAESLARVGLCSAETAELLANPDTRGWSAEVRGLCADPSGRSAEQIQHVGGCSAGMPWRSAGAAESLARVELCSAETAESLGNPDTRVWSAEV